MPRCMVVESLQERGREREWSRGPQLAPGRLKHTSLCAKGSSGSGPHSGSPWGRAGGLQTRGNPSSSLEGSRGRQSLSPWRLLEQSWLPRHLVGPPLAGHVLPRVADPATEARPLYPERGPGSGDCSLRPSVTAQ